MIKKGTSNHRRRRLEKKRREEAIALWQTKMAQLEMERKMQAARADTTIKIEQERLKRLEEEKLNSDSLFILNSLGTAALLLITAFNW